MGVRVPVTVAPGVSVGELVAWVGVLDGVFVGVLDGVFVGVFVGVLVGVVVGVFTGVLVGVGVGSSRWSRNFSSAVPDVRVTTMQLLSVAS